MNKFLKNLEITFRRDPTNYRPRINKKQSTKDREQKLAGAGEASCNDPVARRAVHGLGGSQWGGRWAPRVGACEHPQRKGVHQGPPAGAALLLGAAVAAWSAALQQRSMQLPARAGNQLPSQAASPFKIRRPLLRHAGTFYFLEE